MQAAKASTTRRALLSAAPALPALIATPVVAETISAGEGRRLRKRDFIEQIAGIHPNGRYVATRAMAMDLDPDAICWVQLYDYERDHAMPALQFERNGVYVVVDVERVWEHGPVSSLQRRGQV